MHPSLSRIRHPVFARRTALQAGAIGLLGLGCNHLAALQALAAEARPGKAKTAIYIFLSGGLSQLDSFDLKPDAPDGIRGEFRPIETRTPGIRICEHVPLLAQRSRLWSLVRSLTHATNAHDPATLMMLTGRSELPPGFQPTLPQPGDWPSVAAVAGAVTPARNNLPPAAVLPERLVEAAGYTIPGSYAGLMGRRHDPWLIEASPYDPTSFGAYPEYAFDHQRRPFKNNRPFQAPNITLPEGVDRGRLGGRLGLLGEIDRQRGELEKTASVGNFDRFHQGAVAMLTDRATRRAFDAVHAEPKVQDRYGRNSFGWSLLMARRLVEAGVNLVQVNLGNHATWDTHGFIFPTLKEKLFPPFDRAVSALLDDLQESGLLDSTLVVMAGEFGRTPKISTLPQFYKLPGRDHWGAVQTVFFAGGGTHGGTVVGSSDRIGAFPADNPQTPENLAATIYHCLGIPATVQWRDALDRPHHVYHGRPIAGVVPA